MIVKEILEKEDIDKVYQSYRINKWLESKIDNLIKEIYHLDHNLTPFAVEEITKCDLEELHQSILKFKMEFHRKTEQNHSENLKARRDTIITEII
jgi:hypothetical protein